MAKGFKCIETMECLQREFQVKNITLPDVDDYNFSFSHTTDKVQSLLIHIDISFSYFYFIILSGL